MITAYRTASYDDSTGIIQSTTNNERDSDMLHELNSTPYDIIENELTGWNADALIYCNHPQTPGFYLVEFES